MDSSGLIDDEKCVDGLPASFELLYLAHSIFRQNPCTVIRDFIADFSRTRLCDFQAFNADIFDAVQLLAIGHITQEKR